MIKKLDELIYVKENALDKDFCEHCIQKFKSDERKTPGKIGSGLDLDIKRSLDLNISRCDDWSGEDKIFYNSLHENVQEYATSDWGKKMRLNETHFEDTGYQIQETKPGDFYTWHSDYMSSPDGWSRCLTFLWYLNDVKSGGETEFIMGTKIKPQTGKLILFPAAWMYYHQGCPPKKETKYITTGWLYFNVQDSNPVVSN